MATWQSRKFHNSCAFNFAANGMRDSFPGTLERDFRARERRALRLRADDFENPKVCNIIGERQDMGHETGTSQDAKLSHAIRRIHFESKHDGTRVPAQKFKQCNINQRRVAQSWASVST